MSKILEEWKVDTNIITPLYKQLAENIRWSISTGKVPAGSILPPLRDLARELNLCVNTVRSAYKLLEEQHLVVTRPYHGTEVLNLIKSNRTTSASNGDTSSEDYLFDAVMKLYLQGHKLTEIEKMFEGVKKRISSTNYSNRVLFVECSDYDAQKLSEQIASELDVYVEPVVLIDLENYLIKAKKNGTKYKAIITTYFHYSEVLTAAQGYEIPIYGVVVEMSPETLNYISKMPSHSKIGIICQRNHSIQYLINSIKSIAKDKEVRMTYIDEKEKLQDIVHNWGDAFIVAQTCKKQVADLSPSRPVFFLYDLINDQSITMLRDYLKQNKSDND